MAPQFLDSPVVAFQFLLRKQGMDLRMARPANADGMLDLGSGKFALVALVMMARARDQMVARELFPAPANGADAVHTEHGSSNSGEAAR
jgi:hypothetical protein